MQYTLFRFILMLTISTCCFSSIYADSYVKNSLKRSIRLGKTVDNHSEIEKIIAKMEYSTTIKKIVIDAGHGGHDSGCVGKNSLEKEITLAIALKLEKQIKSKFPKIEILQTRTTDVFIPLFRRIQYANEENADLFISIHCNYIGNSSTRGTETFVMGLHRAEDNIAVAKRENASILLEKNYEQNYDGFDPNSPEGHIMMSMYQNAYLDRSIEFAAEVENQLKSLDISKSRGVKQAGFAVLRRASMPAVLVETGFLSNAEEEKHLKSEEGQNKVAMSIAKAIERYHKVSEVKQIVQNDQKSTPVIVANDNPVTNVTSNKNTPTFAVQIAAVKVETSELITPNVLKVGEVSTIKSGEYIKYAIGKFANRADAEAARDKLKKMGHQGCFIVILP